MLAPWQIPPAELKIDDDQVDLWRIDLTPSGQTAAAVRAWLAADEIARAGRFHFEADRLKYVTGRGGLRDILSRYLGTAPAQVPLTYTEHQKPILNGRPVVHFNLSNSHRLAVLAVSRQGPIGVDLEHRGRPLDDLDDLANTVFSPAEQQALRTTPAAQRQDAFLRGWTRKEAYLKGIGKGLMIPLQDFTVSLEPLDRPASSLKGWYFIDFQPADGYLAALSTPFEVSRLRFFYWQRPWLPSNV